jgi:cation diffusion facilitator family transporter
MLGVLVVNASVAAWQRRQAARLDSHLLRADAHHTFGDVLTTVVVIAGWQLSAAGYRWLDSALAVGVAAIVLYLAYGLFKRAVPVLVDGTAVPSEELHRALREVSGVHSVSRVRSRRTGAAPAVDVVVTVDPELTTVEAHEVADRIERALSDDFDVEDVTVHVEPAPAYSGAAPHAGEPSCNPPS